MLYRYLAICLLGSLPIISSVHADLIIDEDQGPALDVTAWAGEGETPPTSWSTSRPQVDQATFGIPMERYRDVPDMINSLTSETVFQAEMTSFGDFGIFIDNFAYLSDSGDQSNYWAHSRLPHGIGNRRLTAAGGVDAELLTDGLISVITASTMTSRSSTRRPLTDVPAPAGLAVVGLAQWASGGADPLITNSPDESWGSSMVTIPLFPFERASDRCRESHHELFDTPVESGAWNMSPANQFVKSSIRGLSLSKSCPDTRGQDGVATALFVRGQLLKPWIRTEWIVIAASWS